jgi:serine/threonine protein kinase
VNFIPRIGDFGLAREGPQNQYTHMKVSKVHGTRPYLPDEFLRGKQMSTKVDTYSFGIVSISWGLSKSFSKSEAFCLSICIFFKMSEWRLLTTIRVVMYSTSGTRELPESRAF